MADPFAPTHTVVAKPKAPAPRLPIDRLRSLGAPLIVLAEVQRRWQSSNAQERREALALLESATDEELVEAMPEMEVSVVARQTLGTDWHDEGDLVDDAVSFLDDEEAGGSVKALETWVGSDQAKALAVLTLELRRPESDRRSTLLRALEAVVRG